MDARVDDGSSKSIDVVDDSIPLTEGAPLNTSRWSEGTPIIKVRSLLSLHGGSISDRRSCFFLVVHFCDAAHLTY